MRTRSVTSAWIAGLALALALSACGGTKQGTTTPTAAQKVTISYLTHWSGPQVDQLRQAAKSYEAKNPNVSIEIRTVPFGDLLTTLTTQAGSANAPTIAGIYDLWLPQLVKDGIVAPAPDYVANDVRSAYSANVVAASEVDGKLYGYPNEIDLYALNYNRKLFAQAGITQPPSTWAELISDAQKLTKRANGKIVQQGFGLINSWNSGVVHPWLSLVLSDGGQLLSADHKPLLQSKAALAATQLYYDLIFTYEVTDPAMGQANASTTGPYLDNFAHGKTAMIIMANWWESALKDSMGSEFANIGTAPIPSGPDGTSHAVSYSWMTVVNAKATAQQQDAAWKFLQWLDGPESGKNGSSAMGDILMGMGILPSRNSDIAAHQAELDTPFIKTYVDEMKNAVPFPVVLGGDELTTALQKRIESVEFGQAKPDQAMAGAQADLSAILGRYYK